jgi:hypothetical protein
MAAPASRRYILLRYQLNLAHRERCVNVYQYQGMCPSPGWVTQAEDVGSICIAEKLRNWFVGTRLRPTRITGLTSCVCFNKPVWHYVKSGRPELFMYDRNSIKA